MKHKNPTDERFQMPQNFKPFVNTRDKRDTSIDAQKKRLEKQLGDRKHYVTLLEKKQNALSQYIDKPTDENKKNIDLATAIIDLFNIEIEIIAQKHIFVDTYVYYNEDFMKRYKQGGVKKQSVFRKR